MNGSTTPIITLFTAPKAFVGHIGLIQRNAIESWLRLRPTVDILLLGTDAGTAEIAAEFKLKHIPTIERNEFGTPLVSSLFKTVEGHSASKWLMLINADIMLTSEFLQFTARLDRVPKGLYIGLRSDLDVTETIDYSDPQWEQQLITRVKEEGRFRGAGDDSFNGTDYYIYPRDLYPSIPPFAIGRFFWDSWLVADVLRRNLPVVDVSAQITAVHQNHDYGHVKSANSLDMYRYWLNPEAKRNFELVGGRFDDLFGPREASHKLVEDKLVPTGKKLEDLRQFNRNYYFPIKLRAHPLFQPPAMVTLWNYLFPFDATTGRHLYASRGLLRWVKGEVVRPVWKLLPLKLRNIAHLIVQELRRPAQPNAASTVVADIPVTRWFKETLHSSSNKRAIVPADLKSRIPSAFGYGVLRANKYWNTLDLNIHHIVLKRAELSSIPIEKFRTIRDEFKTVYRDNDYAVLTRSNVRAHVECEEWPELAALANTGHLAPAVEPSGDATQQPQPSPGAPRQGVTGAIASSAANGVGSSGAPAAPFTLRRKGTDILAVLNVWKRGPEMLRRQIETLLGQTEPPAEIWVCAFGVEDIAPYQAVLREFSRPNFHFFSSTKNLETSGRFQLALAAETEYVAFIDDDIMIGRDFLRQCRLAIETIKDAGEVGIYGWRRLPGPGDKPIGPYVGAEPYDVDDNRVVPSSELGQWIGHLPEDRDDCGPAEVDLLCGYHFLRTAHVKLVFREQPWSLVACDDILIAFALRKYAGVRSFVIGIDPKNPDTWGLSPDWRTLGVEKATTVGDMLPVRDMHFWRLLNRGNTFAWMRDEQNKAMRYHFAAFSNAAEASTLYKALSKSVDFDERTKVLALWCGPRRDDARSAVPAFGSDVSDQIAHAWSWLDMELGLDADGPFGQRTLGSNAIFGIGALIEGLQPEAIWLVQSDESIVRAAIEIAATGSKARVNVVRPE